MRLMATVFVLALLETSAAAADLSGSWRLHLDPDFGGNEDSFPCRFVQEERKLTIDCGRNGLPITGEVNGVRVTFDVKTGRNNELTAVFTGTLDEATNTITGTWRLDAGNEARNGRFDARRQ
jgi:hypothetical protein